MNTLPDSTCKMRGCELPRRTRGYCEPHYKQLRKQGKLPTIRPYGASLSYRFWDKVDKRSPSECWEWTGTRTGRGYGRLARNRIHYVATHVSWYLHYGEWPNDLGMWVLHRCDNPPCVNPAHLFLGTRADNVRDMVRKGRSLRNKPRGERHHKAKLGAAEVRSIRAEFASGATVPELAEAYGVSRSNIQFIVAGTTWRHLLPKSQAEYHPDQKHNATGADEAQKDV